MIKCFREDCSRTQIPTDTGWVPIMNKYQSTALIELEWPTTREMPPWYSTTMVALDLIMNPTHSTDQWLMLSTSGHPNL